MLLEGKKLLVTGVLTRDSIAYAIAHRAQEQGAEIVLTSFQRAMALTTRTARSLPEKADVLEMDVTDQAQIDAVVDELTKRWGSVDGFVHSVAFAPKDALGGDFLGTPWASAEVAFRTSSYSLKAVAAALLPLMQERGGSIVSMDFDASVAWPLYDWMGVCKAALESISRYLARDLGRHSIRVNCVSAGPLRTVAAKAIPGFDTLASAWSSRSPLPWDVENPQPVADAAVFLLSDMAAAITGEILHVDGGYHAMGAGLEPSEQE